MRRRLTEGRTIAAGSIFFDGFADEGGACANSNLTGRSALRVDLLNAFRRLRSDTHAVGQLRQTHRIAQALTLLQAPLRLQRPRWLVKQRDVVHVGDLGENDWS